MPQKIEATTILNWSKDGKAHIPLAVRKVLGNESEKSRADVYCIPKIVLLVNHNTGRKDVLAGIEVLRQSLLLSWGIQETRPKDGERN